MILAYNELRAVTQGAGTVTSRNDMCRRTLFRLVIIPISKQSVICEAPALHFRRMRYLPAFHCPYSSLSRIICFHSLSETYLFRLATKIPPKCNKFISLARTGINPGLPLSGQP